LQRAQASSASQASAPQPFAALLDATVSMPASANVPQNAPVAPQPPSEPANSPSAGSGSSESNTSDAADANQNAAPGPTADPDTTSATTAAPNTSGGLLTAPPKAANSAAAFLQATGGTKAPTNSAKGASRTSSVSAALDVVPNLTGGPVQTSDTNGGAIPGAKTTNAPGGPSNTVPQPNAPAAKGGDATQIPAVVSAPAVVVPQADSQIPQPTTTTNAGGTKDDKGDDDASVGAIAAQPANPSQPLAAAIVVNIPAAASATAAATAPVGSAAAATAPVGDAAIGEQTKVRVRAGQPGDADQDTAPAQDASQGPTDVAAGQQAKLAASGDPTVKPASDPSPDAANAANATPLQATDDTTSLSQTQVTAGDGTGHASTPTAGLSALSSSEAGASGPGGTGAAKTTADGVPNFGFSLGAAAPSSAPAANAATTSAAAVPIAGLAVAIAARAQAGSNQFEIRLDPPELGRIDVHLDVDRDGQVTSHVTADRPDTLALLQSQQPQLERALEQAGLKTANNGLQFTLRDQSFAGQNNGGNGPQPRVAQLVIPDTSPASVDPTQIYTRSGLGGGLDIRV
jgi:flagellar hook-length control protein FliK